MSAQLQPASRLSLRRRKRIERELAVLRTMESHLFTKEIVWAVLTIPGVAALVVLVAWKAHWWSDSPLVAVAVAALDRPHGLVDRPALACACCNYRLRSGADPT
jgi:hypothetical protein